MTHPDHPEDLFRSLDECPACSGEGRVGLGHAVDYWTGTSEAPEAWAPCSRCDGHGWISELLVDEVADPPDEPWPPTDVEAHERWSAERDAVRVLAERWPSCRLCHDIAATHEVHAAGRFAHYVCDRCARETEETTREVTEHELRCFSGDYADGTDGARELGREVSP